MRHLLMRIALAVAAAVIVTPVQAQISVAGFAPAQLPQVPYSGFTYQGYPIPAPTPEDAYREGLINRWELEQLTGPVPLALQGPSVNGTKGGDSGGGRD